MRSYNFEQEAQNIARIAKKGAGSFACDANGVGGLRILDAEGLDRFGLAELQIFKKPFVFVFKGIPQPVAAYAMSWWWDPKAVL